MSKKLTILMPLYNQEQYLSQAIDSVLMQKTNFDYELIIIDDKSTDKSLSIAKDYQKKHLNKITIIENIYNLKLLKTIMKGYENIQTEYFTVLDPDDYYIVDNKFQKAIDFLENNKDFTIYSTNAYNEHLDNKRDLFVKIEEKKVISDFENIRKSVLSHTSASVFRNVVFNKGIPIMIKDLLNSKDGEGFRADSFRNFSHLSLGKSYFSNEVESIYRITSKGIWTSLNAFEKNNVNLRAFLNFLIYFNTNKDYFADLCSYFCHQNISLLEDVFENKDNRSKEDLNEFKEILTRYILILEKNKFTAEDNIRIDNGLELLRYRERDKEFKKAAKNYRDSNWRHRLYYKIYKHLSQKIEKSRKEDCSQKEKIGFKPINLFKWLKKKEEIKKVPSEGLIIELNSNCNVRCVWCQPQIFKKHKMTQMSATEFEKIITDNLDFIKETYNVIMLYTRGEPLIHKEFWDICAVLDKYDLFDKYVEIHSNLSSEIDLEMFKKYSKLHVVANFGGTTKEVHEQVMRYSNFELVTQNYKNLRKIGFEIKAKITPTKLNIHQVEGFYDFVESMGGKRDDAIISTTGIMMPYALTKEERDDFFENVVSEEVKPYLRFEYDLSKEDKGIDVKRKICPFLLDTICSDGRLSICCHDKAQSEAVGSVYNKTLKEIRKSKKYKQARKFGYNRQLPICNNCN